MQNKSDRPFVAYYRVSTPEQAAQGLGLEAQRVAVAKFLGDVRPIAEFPRKKAANLRTSGQSSTARCECVKRPGQHW